MKRNTVKQISGNIREAFAIIHKDVQRHFDPEVTVENAREQLSQHVPVWVMGCATSLFDSLLNYLMKDAVDSLSDAPTDVKNAFYAMDMRIRLKNSFALEPKTLQFSADPRDFVSSIAAGGTLIAGGVFVGLLFTDVVVRIIAGLAVIIASAIAFRFAYSASTESARRTLESDISSYLLDSETQITNWLANVERSFANAFDTFATEHGIQERDES